MNSEPCREMGSPSPLQQQQESPAGFPRLQFPIHESLEGLYQSTPWSVFHIESYEMDQLLHALQTPAHQCLFVLQHAYCSFGDMDVVLAHCRHLWKPKSQFDGPRLEALLLLQRQHQSPMSTQNKPQIHLPVKENVQSSKKIADSIVSLQSSGVNHSNNRTKTIHLLHSLYLHLYLTLGTDLRNGAAADVALSLAMAGVGHDFRNDEDDEALLVLEGIHHILAHIAALELERKKTKGSRRSTDILMVVEKLAAAGCRGIYMERAAKAALDSLEGSKGYAPTMTETLRWNLWSPRPLLWLWRRGHLLHKVSMEDSRLSHTVETLQPPDFDDPTLPLVIDVGCGLGVSLIGLLASSSLTPQSSSTHPSPLDHLDWSRCNYLGGDLSPAAIRWAKGMAKRWKFTGQCHFDHVSTDVLLEYLLQSKINVSVILLQFPTPYRLQQEEGNCDNDDDENEEAISSGGCNLKLPSGPTDESFMANPQILKRMAMLLSLGAQPNPNQPTYLVVQSNCEDVALQLYDTLVNLGLEPIVSETPRSLESLVSYTTPTTRTTSWLHEQELVGNRTVRRAAGLMWSSEPVLPVLTETEAACLHLGTPVHRCVFRSPR